MTNLWLICSWAKLPRRERRTWWWSSPAPAEQSRVPQARPLACPKSLRVLGFAHCPVRRDKEDNVVKSWCFGENGGNAVTAKEGVLLPSAQLLGYQREAGAKVKCLWRWRNCNLSQRHVGRVKEGLDLQYFGLTGCLAHREAFLKLHNRPPATVERQTIRFHVPGLCQDALDALHLTVPILQLLRTERLLGLWIHVALRDQHLLRLGKLTERTGFKTTYFLLFMARCIWHSMFETDLLWKR